MTSTPLYDLACLIRDFKAEWDMGSGCDIADRWPELRGIDKASLFAFAAVHRETGILVAGKPVSMFGNEPPRDVDYTPEWQQMRKVTNVAYMGRI